MGCKKVNTSSVIDTPISPWLKAKRDAKLPRGVAESVSVCMLLSLLSGAV